MNPDKYSITFIVPALNEETNLEPSINSVLEGIKDFPSLDYEIIVFNDGSNDHTGEIAENIAVKNKNIKVVHHKDNMNLGYTLKEGLMMASKDYFVIAPAHNRVQSVSYKNIVNSLGKGDVIVGYIANSGSYPFKRRIISISNTILINSLFGLKVRYYHFPVLRTDLAKKINISTSSYAAMSEIVIKLLKSGASYAEVPVYTKERSSGRSSALRPKNLLGILKALAVMYWGIIIKHKNI